MDSYLAIALTLIGCGAVLLATEFVLPTGGIAVVLGTVLIIAAVGVILLYGDTQEAIAAVISVSIGLPLAMYALFAVWKQMTVIPGVDSESAIATMHELPEIAELDRLKGRFGRAVTPMRPAGSVEIDGRRIDAMSEGPLIDANQWIKCIAVKSGRVIVRQVEAPGDLSDLPLDGLT